MPPVYACRGEGSAGGAPAEASAADSAHVAQAARSASAPAPAPVPLDGAAFRDPQAVLYDADLDVYFVSNRNGAADSADDDGFISRVRPDGMVDSLRFIVGGRHGAKLDAPRGMAIAGNTLWVADITWIRGFDKRTGRVLASFDLRPQGARSLAGMAVAADGALYISDARAGRLIRLAPTLGRGVAFAGGGLGVPDGLLWDPGRGKLLVASRDRPDILAFTPGDSAVSVAARGPASAGGFVGLARLDDGRIVAASSGGGLYLLGADGRLTRVYAGAGVAELGADTKRGRLLLPVPGENRVRILEMPKTP